MESDAYVFDPFDDGSRQATRDAQVGAMRDFVAGWGSRLHDVEEALDESLSQVWDADMDPVKLAVKPYEQTTLLELAKTDNKLFNKIIVVFASLCCEIRTLESIAETKFYPAFVAYGLYDDAEEGDVQVQMGKMLPLIVDMDKFLSRCYTVMQNMICQLASLYHADQIMYRTSYRSVHFQTVFEHIGSLLTVCVTLDQVIGQNALFHDHWAKFKRMTKGVEVDPSSYGASLDQVMQLEKLLLSLEGKLFTGLIYQSCVQQEFEFPGLVEVRRSKAFRDEFATNLYAMQDPLCSRLNYQTEKNSARLLSICTLYGLFINVFRDRADRSKFRQLWDTHKVIPIVHLVGNVYVFPTEFLLNNAGIMMDAVSPGDVLKFRRNYLSQMDNALSTQVNVLYHETSIWMVRMESNLSNRATLRDILNMRVSLLREGVRLAHRLSITFKTLHGLHANMSVPWKPQHIGPLCRCMHLLKAIQNTFHRRSAMLGESVSLMAQQLSFFLQKNFLPVKKRLEGDRRFSDAKLDILAAVTLAVQMLAGAATPERHLLLRLAMHVFFQSSFAKPQEIAEVQRILSDLELVGNIQEVVARACETSYVFWNREIIAVWMQGVFARPTKASHLPCMLSAMEDVLPMVLERAAHTDPAALAQRLKDEVYDLLQDVILEPLCRDVEVDLRYQIHVHLNVEDRDPFRKGVRDLSPFFALEPLRFGGRTINLRTYAEHYLDTVFYNLTTVAQYDWKTYEEMRNLAGEKYGLMMTEVHLPGQTLEQGLDVLEIMRNIHVFVARYNYNMNTQVFVETESDSKFLNTINVPVVANSVRTHGIGFMNTTVNYTFQFLAKKFVIFSQFLFDDHIKSRLYKDIRFYQGEREALNHRYPYERARIFNREIHKLGTSDTGMSFLDQFRVLVTEIGNAMGYIRMVRSGGLEYISNAVKFVPDLGELVKFEPLAAEAELGGDTVSAARNLDTVLDSLVRNFSEGTQYFKMLVNVFAQEFRSEKNAHLQRFYMIVPPLTVNYIEHIVNAKNKLDKKGKQGFGGRFTDDGFALGVAYILKLLDQNDALDSLHWFESMHDHYQSLQRKIQGESKKLSRKDQQAKSVTMRNVSNEFKEAQLLRFTLSGARVFFTD